MINFKKEICISICIKRDFQKNLHKFNIPIIEHKNMNVLLNLFLFCLI